MPSRSPSNRLPLVVLAAVALAACSHGGTVRGRAAFDLDCPEAELLLAEQGGDVVRVTGCGATAHYRCYLSNMESVCRSAVPPPKTDAPRRITPAGAAEARAPGDLACPAEAVEVFTLPGEAYGARGCGRRISYTCSQRFWSYACQPEGSVRSDRARTSATP